MLEYYEIKIIVGLFNKVCKVFCDEVQCSGDWYTPSWSIAVMAWKFYSVHFTTCLFTSKGISDQKISSKRGYIKSRPPFINTIILIIFKLIYSFFILVLLMTISRYSNKIVVLSLLVDKGTFFRLEVF